MMIKLPLLAFLAVLMLSQCRLADDTPRGAAQRRPTAPDARRRPHAPLIGADKISAGDTAWMLTSTALVLMMCVPGLALFYGGMVRKKNVLATLMQSFASYCVVTILWWLVGYSWAFTPGSNFIGRLQPRAVQRHDLHPRRRQQADGVASGADHSGNRLRDVSADLRDHHARR